MWTVAAWGLALALGRPELALQELTSSGDVPPGEVRLEWSTSEGWQRVDQPLLFGGPPIASPRTSLSPLVVRPQVGRKGIEGRLILGKGVDLQNVAESLEIGWVEHERLDEVLIARRDDEVAASAWLISDPHAPKWTLHRPWDRHGFELEGTFAYRDGVSGTHTIRVLDEEGEKLGPGTWLLLTPGEQAPLPDGVDPVPSGASPGLMDMFRMQSIEFAVDGFPYPRLTREHFTRLPHGAVHYQDNHFPVDQAVEVSIATVDAWNPVDQRVTPDASRAQLDLRLRSPKPEGSDRSWTLLVRLNGNAPGVSSANPAPASPREARAALDSGAFQPWYDGPWSVHLEGPREQLDIRPTMGPGIAAGDADGDGALELYVVQGGGRGDEHDFTNQLYTDLDGPDGPRVEVVTGAEDEGAGMGALFFDASGDGDLDLFVANYGPDSLYENDPGEQRWVHRFHDVSESAGVRGPDRAALWSAGVCAGDPDRDGDLDLYVTSYLEYDESQMPSMEDLPYAREDPVAMLPFAFPGQRNTYFENQSDGAGLKFVDRTAELGVLDVQGRGMQSVFWDYDQDGRDDLYIANDVSMNVLYKARATEAGFGFRDVSFQTGLDDPRGGMGLALGDVDGDLDEDVFLTNWQLETNALYLNNLLSHDSQKHRVASFRDSTVEAGFGPYGVGVTSWGCELFDLELDGDLDLFVANGYTSPDYESTGICVGQPNHLYLGDGEGRFAPAFEMLGAFGSEKLPSRAALTADLDRDGDLDLVVTANNSALRILRNGVEREGRWLGLRLRGQGANTHAVGARVIVRAGELEHLRVLRAGTSYLAGNAPELHFGLGDVERIREVEVQWPSGRVTRHADLSLDAWQTLAEPAE
ncbi:MAG: CRTAC1 family protein [Planctomycetota bacterium]